MNGRDGCIRAGLQFVVSSVFSSLLYFSPSQSRCQTALCVTCCPWLHRSLCSEFASESGPELLKCKIWLRQSVRPRLLLDIPWSCQHTTLHYSLLHPSPCHLWIPTVHWALRWLWLRVKPLCCKMCGNTINIWKDLEHSRFYYVKFEFPERV